MAKINKISNKKIILEIKNASKKYRKGDLVRAIFEKINFSIYSEDLVAVIGKSGSGKTLLLNCILGNEQLDNGNILFDDKNLGELTESEREKAKIQKFSVIYKENNLFTTLTVKENLDLAIKISKKETDNKFEDFYEKVIKVLKIKDKLNKEIESLDFLEYQIVSLARAIIMQPKIIFLDEPGGYLSETENEEFIKIIKEVNQTFGIAMVIFSHDPKVAVNISKVIRM